MSDSPPPDDSIDDDIMTFDESLPNMDDDPPDDDDFDDGPPPDDDFDDDPPDDDMEDDGPPDDDIADDGPPDDDMEDDGPPDDSIDDGPPPDDSVIEDEKNSVDESDMGPPDDDTNIEDDGPPDDEDDGPPDDTFDEDEMDDDPPDDDDIDDGPPNDDSMTLPEDDTTLPPDSIISNDEPPPSDMDTLPPPSPSVDGTVNDDDDTMDEDMENRRKATGLSRKERDSVMAGRKSTARTSILSDGLDPKIVKMGESLASIEDDEDDEDEDEEEESTVESQGVQQQAPRTVDYSKRGSVIIDGAEYILVQGKFEGDDFEQLMVKVESNMFFVKTPVDENVIIPFDLGIDTKAKRDENAENIFYLNQKGQLITFEADSGRIVNELFEKFPPDTIVTEFEHISVISSEESSVVSDKKEESSFASSFADLNLQGKENKGTNDNKKDNTFNEIDIDDPNFNIDDYDMDENGALVLKQQDKKSSSKQDSATESSPSVVKSSPVGRTMLSPSRNPQISLLETVRENDIRGHSKRDIVTAKLMKPRFSARRIKQICNWITSLGIWHKPITIVTLHSELCNGILLSKMAKKLIPSANFNYNARALTEKAAMSNLELSLGAFWRTKCVNNSRIASAADIYNGNINKTVITLQELFEVYVVQPLFAQAPKMFRWYNNILKQYNIPIPEAIFNDGDLIDLWNYVQSGFAIFCVIHHLYGPMTVGESVDMVRIDAKRIVSKPQNVNEYRDNIKYLFAILKALKVPCLYDLDDWLTYPDTEFIVYQLYVIYEALKHRQCSLPPAQGQNAGVTSGPNGDPIVTGMIFKDTPVDGQTVVKKKPLGVFLGGGGDSIQLLPIDTSGDSNTVYRMVCPLGLMSTKVKIVHANVKAKEEKSNVARKAWNQSVSVELVKSASSQKKIDILKQTHTPGNVLQSPIRVHDEEKSTAAQQPVGLAPPPSPKKLSTEELNNEIEKLEVAMEDSQQEMEGLEEELAIKYLELEHEADLLGDNEYNSRFSFLEKERVALERERSKLQDFFAQQLKNLRKMSSSSSLSPKSKKDKNSSFYSATRKSGGRDSKVIEKKKHAERGWNQFVNNNESHNNVFKTKNQNTSSSFLSPTKHSTYNVEKDRTMNSHKFTLEEPPKVKKTKDEVWKDFKGKLRDANIRWMSTKSHRRGHKIQELMTPKAPLEMKRRVDFNRVPKIHVQTKLDEIVYEPGTPAFIRKRELELMKIEEARRWMVIQREEEMEAIHLSNLSKQEIDESLPPPPPSPGTQSPARLSFASKHDTPLLQSKMSPIPKRQTPGTRTPYSSKQMPFFSPSPFAQTPVNEAPLTRNLSSNQDFEAMLSWLAFPRTMSLRDRNSKQAFQFTIEEEKTKQGDYFIVKWYRIEKNSLERNLAKASNAGKPNKELLEGYVNCEDIISAKVLSKAPMQLVLRLSSSPRCLKSSGGRTVMTIVFSSDTECAKYCDGLNELIPAYD